MGGRAQGAHRLWPSRSAGRSPQSVAKIRLASATYDALAQVCYYSQDVPRGVYSSLRASNLAVGVGPCPELARSGATMCIASSLIPLHRLAEAYGRRAWATAEAIDDPPTRPSWRSCSGSTGSASGIGRPAEKAGRGRRNRPAHRQLEEMGGKCRRAGEVSSICRAISTGPWTTSGNSGARRGRTATTRPRSEAGTANRRSC